MNSLTDPEFRLLQRATEALEKIAVLMEASGRPGVVAPEIVTDITERTVDGVPRKEPA